MIIKIKSHKRDSFQKILEYMLNDRQRVIDQKNNTFVITHNLNGKSISTWVKQYQQNELLRSYRRKDSVRLTHEIISWHRKDAKNITLDKLESMGREYIKHRNPNGIYVIVPHFDKDHYHLHVCASGVEYQTGKSLRLSKADLLKFKKGLQEFQKENFPELTNSIENHGANRRDSISDKEYQFKLRTGRATNREHFLSILVKCQKQSHSKDHFINLLQNHNLQTYERSGRLTGIIHDGIKFRFSRLGLSESFLKEIERTDLRSDNITALRDRETKNKFLNR